MVHPPLSAPQGLSPHPASVQYLYYYRTLSVSRDNDTSAMWGKLGAEILMQNWETASEVCERPQTGLRKWAVQNVRLTGVVFAAPVLAA